MSEDNPPQDLDIEFFSWLFLNVPIVALFWATICITVFLLTRLFLAGWGNHNAFEYVFAPFFIFLIVGFQTAQANIITLPAFSGLIAILATKIRRAPWWLLIGFTPLLALTTFYGYEHFVPGYRFMLDDTPDYIYGLTWERFLTALSVNVIFAVVYWRSVKRRLALPTAMGEANATSAASPSA